MFIEEAVHHPVADGRNRDIAPLVVGHDKVTIRPMLIAA